MIKLTKQQFDDIVACVRKDIANYVAKTKAVFTENNKVEELQYDDIVYVNNALVEFLLDKDVVKLTDKLMHQDTFVREEFLSAIYYCEEEEIYAY